MRKAALATLALSVSVLAIEAAQANVVSGTTWEVATSIARNATIGNVPQPGSLPNATWSVNSPLNFSSTATPSGYTLGGFLASGGAFGITYNSGATSGDTLNSTITEVKGTVSVVHGETFDVGHDDGFSIMIGGWLFSDPGPTSFSLTPVLYTGPTGNLPFTMAYGECCGPPAFLTVDLPLSNVPEPSTWAMMAIGFAGLGFAAYGRSRKARPAIA
jgi:hypothetical protein